MTTLSPALDAALTAPAVLVAGFVEIVLPGGGFLRLLDGEGMAGFGGRSFAGSDPTYGVLGEVTAFADGVDGEAPSTSITILPPTNTAAAALASPAMQGMAVSLWIGAVDPVSGGLLGEPDLRFVGQVDVPVLKVGQGTRAVEISVVSAFEAMFADNEGVRLSDAWHQSVWPGETGLAGVTSVLRQLPWGSDAPKPSVSTGVTGGGGGGGRGVFGDTGIQLPF